MKTLKWFVAIAVLLEMAALMAAAPANAQSQQATPIPGSPPQVLVLVRQEFQFGREGERARLAATLSHAFDRIDVPNLWIDLQSITGEPAALSFDPMDSFAQVDDAFAAWGEIFASHPDLARLQNQVRALETSERTIIAVQRPDLSYQAGSIDLSKAHFMRVLEVRVRPGHEDQFATAFKALRAAYAKISADLPWVVYQVNLGSPSPAFLAFVPMHDLKQNDDLLAWRPLLHEAEGETEAGEMQQIASDAYLSTESNLYAISPATSHVSKEFAAGDPDFWSPKPTAAAKPAANGLENVDSQKSAKPKRNP